MRFSAMFSALILVGWYFVVLQPDKTVDPGPPLWLQKAREYNRQPIPEPTYPLGPVWTYAPREVGPFPNPSECWDEWLDTFDALRAMGATWALPSKACFRKP